MVGAVAASLNLNASSRGGTHQNPRRLQLLTSEADNGSRRLKSREVASLYVSSTSSTSTTSSSATSSSSSSSNSSSSRLHPSQIASRTGTPTPALSLIKQSQSTERRRHSTSRPKTPTAGEMSAAAKLLVAYRKSLSVSFQGASFSFQDNKRKPATSADNVRKSTPERRKAAVPESRKAATPAREHLENSKPSDQHRWPGRYRQLNSLTRSLDFTAEKKKIGGSPGVNRALQQSMIFESSKPSFDDRLEVETGNAGLKKASRLAKSAIESALTFDSAASETDNVTSQSIPAVQQGAPVTQARRGPRGIVVPARFWQETDNRLRRLPRPGSPVSDSSLSNSSQKLIATKKMLSDSQISLPRGVSTSSAFSSPLPGAVSTAPPKKLTTSSPSPARNGVASTLGKKLNDTQSVLTFAPDIRRGKIGENRIADAHLLRLLYNQHLQWRFLNARTDNSVLVQRVNAEKNLYNAWIATSKLRHSVKSKRMELHLLKQNLKLYSILKGQILYLDGWDIIEGGHFSSLSGAIKALEANTLCLPVVGGAIVDFQNVKDAMCSGLDVMQAMASSICSLLLKVEQVNTVVAELAKITTEECALLKQSRDILAALTGMQVKDCSLRTHILQLKRITAASTWMCKADAI